MHTASGCDIDAYGVLALLISCFAWLLVSDNASFRPIAERSNSPPDRSPATHRLRRFNKNSADSQSALKIHCIAGCHAREGAEDGAGNAYI